MKSVLMSGVLLLSLSLNAQANPVTLNTIYHCEPADPGVGAAELYGSSIMVAVGPELRGQHQLALLSEVLGGAGCRASSDTRQVLQCDNDRVGVSIGVSADMAAGDAQGMMLLHKLDNSLGANSTFTYNCTRT